MKTLECINLRATYGRQYRVMREPPAVSFADPWSHLLRCMYGHIYPHGGKMLGWASSKNGPVSKAVARLSGVQVVQDGSDGMNVIFHQKDFDRVAQIVRPRRRRIMSEAQKEAARTRLAGWHLKKPTSDEVWEAQN